MTKIERSALCVHGHFSQPPRGDPRDGTIGVEADATPYLNWNERITHTSYHPNAEIGNFGYISFSFSEGLLKWLEENAPETYSRIVEADRRAHEANLDGGNALATAYNHVILPLSRRRDKRTQVVWGLAAFEHHYGRPPLGFWLPEMAVDTETLVVLAEAGIKYTVLTGRQILDHPAGKNAGSYRIDLPGGKSISVFARDDALSTELSFNIHNLGGAGLWCRQTLAPTRKAAGPLTLIAIAGETFGHHYAGEEQFLHWLVAHEAAQAGFQITTLDRYYLDNPPAVPAHIEERSSWGDQRGLTEWATGSTDGRKDTTWKGALRRALDNAASDVDRVYEEMIIPLGADPWTLRDSYLPALLRGEAPDEFVATSFPRLKSAQRSQLTGLLHAERLIQRMYNSYTFTDPQIDGRQPRYAIACAATALTLVQTATGRDMNDRLPADLAVVTSAATPVTGADMLRDAAQAFDLTPFM